MDGISEEDVQRVKATLGSISPVLVLIVRNAWRVWQRDLLKMLPGCHVRTRRILLWSLMLQEAKLRLSDSSDIAFRETRQGHVVIIVRGSRGVGSIVLRFKHLHQDFTTRNYPTQGAIRYGLQLPLPGVPRGTRLTIGYTLNAAETELAGIFWVWSVGARILYLESLVEDDRTIELPLEETRRSAARRVQPKKRKDDEASGTEN
jgi:hypothetical protein